ncbi:MAG: hypothetical protein NZ108_10720, partial [Bacteroidia bacterium]|nr:hypothetical protein [Bacteroidia bacterium]
MKKGLILTFALLSVSTAFAQQKKFNPATAYKADKFTVQEERRMVLRNPQSTNRSAMVTPRPQTRTSSTSALGTVVQLGRATNAYTMLRTSQNMVFTSNETNTIGFIHRQSNDDWGGNPPAVANGQIRLDFSKDEGANWDLDIGPFNPIPNQANGRYPQAGVFVPPGVTDFCNSYVGWEVALTDGSGWGNYSYGLAKGFGQSGTQQANFCSQPTTSTELYLSTAQD